MDTKIFNCSFGFFIRLSLLLLPGILSVQLQAQVTIGLGEEPIPGALLQLKDTAGISGDAANASRGLALPRIMLSDNNELYPMFLDNPNDPLSGPSECYSLNKPDLDKTHTGLIVYNLNDQNGFKKGIYVWDGFEWDMNTPQPWYKIGEDVPSRNNTDPSYLMAGVAINKKTLENDASLDVNGLVQVAGTKAFRYRDGSQQQGYVLTSDAGGYATWEPFTTGGGVGEEGYRMILSNSVTKFTPHVLSINAGANMYNPGEKNTDGLWNTIFEDKIKVNKADNKLFVSVEIPLASPTNSGDPWYSYTIGIFLNNELMGVRVGIWQPNPNSSYPFISVQAMFAIEGIIPDGNSICSLELCFRRRNSHTNANSLYVGQAVPTANNVNNFMLRPAMSYTYYEKF